MGLPKNWVEVSLGDIIYLKNGNAFKKSEYTDKGISIIRMSDLVNGEVSTSKSVKVPDSNEYDKYIIEKGDLLIGMSGSIGKYGVFNLDEKVYLNQRVGNLKLYSEDNFNKTLLKFLVIKIQEDLVKKAYGGTIPNISSELILNTKIGLPPLPEQERIVAKLDTLFGQINQMKQSLERIPQLLANFKQQVLSQAVTGKLTKTWREGKLLKETKHYKLEDICSSITDGDHQAPPKAETGIPFLVISNVSKGVFDFDSVTRFVPQDYFNSLKETRIPKKGDILYTVTGSFGIPLLVNFNKDFCFQRHIAILKPSTKFVLPEYLIIHLKSKNAIEQAKSVATGTAQLTVPLRGLRKFNFPIHSLEEQQEIVNRAESLFAKADAIEAQYQALKAKIDSLPQAILHKAFKGELVSQLPTDGDAKDLLKEIERLKTAATPKKKSTKKKTYTKTKTKIPQAAEPDGAGYGE